MSEELEAEIAAAKVRLGFSATDPVPGNLVVQQLPEALHSAFWDRQIRRWAELNGLDMNSEV